MHFSHDSCDLRFWSVEACSAHVYDTYYTTSLKGSNHPNDPGETHQLLEVMMVATFDSREARAAPPGWVGAWGLRRSDVSWRSCGFKRGNQSFLFMFISHLIWFYTDGVEAKTYCQQKPLKNLEKYLYQALARSAFCLNKRPFETSWYNEQYVPCDQLGQHELAGFEGNSAVTKERFVAATSSNQPGQPQLEHAGIHLFRKA